MIKDFERLSKLFPLALRRSVPLKGRNSFLIGGEALYFFQPQNWAQLFPVYRFLQAESLPFDILGSGSNVWIPDEGLPHLVLSTLALQNIRFSRDAVYVEAGASVAVLCEQALQRGLDISFLYGMPGTVGGAIWMNARCYGQEIASYIRTVFILNEEGELERVPFRIGDYAYKKSPFQQRKCLILGALLSLPDNAPSAIAQAMHRHVSDRQSKGHYAAPCAGSIFKNNHSWGASSGAIIEKAGLKGYTIGQAAVAPYHANIIINRGNARSEDILNLIEVIKKAVYRAWGFLLEPEIVFLGLKETSC